MLCFAQFVRSVSLQLPLIFGSLLFVFSVKAQKDDLLVVNVSEEQKSAMENVLVKDIVQQHNLRFKGKRIRPLLKWIYRNVSNIEPDLEADLINISRFKFMGGLKSHELSFRDYLRDPRLRERSTSKNMSTLWKWRTFKVRPSLGFDTLRPEPLNLKKTILEILGKNDSLTDGSEFNKAIGILLRFHASDEIGYRVLLPSKGRYLFPQSGFSEITQKIKRIAPSVSFIRFPNTYKRILETLPIGAEIHSRGEESLLGGLGLLLGTQFASLYARASWIYQGEISRSLKLTKIGGQKFLSLRFTNRQRKGKEYHAGVLKRVITVTPADSKSKIGLNLNFFEFQNEIGDEEVFDYQFNVDIAKVNQGDIAAIDKALQGNIKDLLGRSRSRISNLSKSNAIYTDILKESIYHQRSAKTQLGLYLDRTYIKKDNLQVGVPRNSGGLFKFQWKRKKEIADFTSTNFYGQKNQLKNSYFECDREFNMFFSLLSNRSKTCVFQNILFQTPPSISQSLGRSENTDHQHYVIVNHEARNRNFNTSTRKILKRYGSHPNLIYRDIAKITDQISKHKNCGGRFRSRVTIGFDAFSLVELLSRKRTKLLPLVHSYVKSLISGDLPKIETLKYDFSSYLNTMNKILKNRPEVEYETLVRINHFIREIIKVRNQKHTLKEPKKSYAYFSKNSSSFVTHNYSTMVDFLLFSEAQKKKKNLQFQSPFVRYEARGSSPQCRVDYTHFGNLRTPLFTEFEYQSL